VVNCVVIVDSINLTAVGTAEYQKKKINLTEKETNKIPVNVFNSSFCTYLFYMS